MTLTGKATPLAARRPSRHRGQVGGRLEPEHPAHGFWVVLQVQARPYADLQDATLRLLQGAVPAGDEFWIAHRGMQEARENQVTIEAHVCVLILSRRLRAASGIRPEPPSSDMPTA